MFRTKYNHNDPISPNGGVSATQQQYKNECDINCLIKSFVERGTLPPTRGEGVSGDFSDIGDFQSCLDRVNRAKDEFMALPAKIRDRFGGDPTAYVGFVLDPANTEECIRLGLKEKIVKEDTPVEVLKRIEKTVTPKEHSAASHADGSAS